MMPWAPNIRQSEKGWAESEDSREPGCWPTVAPCSSFSCLRGSCRSPLSTTGTVEVPTRLTALSPPMEFSSQTPMTVNYKWSQTHMFNKRFQTYYFR